MTTVAFLVRAERPQAERIAAETSAWLRQRGERTRTLLLVEPDRVVEDGVELPLHSVDLTKVDVAVALGGDGTFLRLVGMAGPYGTPLLGVNFGRLGYLLRTPPEEVRSTLDSFLAGRCTTEPRALLEITLPPVEESTDASGAPLGAQPARPEGEEAESRAARYWEPPSHDQRHWLVLNEVVLEKTVPGHTIEVTTSIDGQRLTSYRADGVLVATATGSTAYNFSAGGPVLAPDLSNVILTPVAPHLTNPASLVLDEASVVELRVDGDRPAVAVMDGVPGALLPPGSGLTCRIAEIPARLVAPRRTDLAVALGPVLARTPLT